MAQAASDRPSIKTQLGLLQAKRCRRAAHRLAPTSPRPSGRLCGGLQVAKRVPSAAVACSLLISRPPCAVTTSLSSSKSALCACRNASVTARGLLLHQRLQPAGPDPSPATRAAALPLQRQGKGQAVSPSAGVLTPGAVQNRHCSRSPARCSRQQPPQSPATAAAQGTRLARTGGRRTAGSRSRGRGQLRCRLQQ